MGVITDALRQRISTQLQIHRIVVWFDPEERYKAFVTGIDLPAITCECYDGSFFELRHRIDPLLNAVEPPRLLVYVPLRQDATHHALIELTSLGVALSPEALGDASTDLRHITDATLQGKLSQEAIDQVLAMIKDSAKESVSLAQLDAVIDQYAPRRISLLNTIYQANDDAAILLRFLCDPAHDTELLERNLWPELIALCHAQTDLLLTTREVAAQRDRLAQWILQSDLLASLVDPPPQLQTIDAAPAGEQRRCCVDLAARWRQSDPDAYLAQATRVEQLLHLEGLPLSGAQAGECWTFPVIDELLQTALEGMIATQPAALALVATRQRGYWARQVVTGAERFARLVERWKIIQLAGQLCQRADRVMAAVAQPGLTARELVERYTAPDDPWCLLDTLQRALEHVEHRQRPSTRLATTQALITTARQRYQHAAEGLASAFTHAWRDADFEIAAVLTQREIFASRVQPALQRGRVAYLLIDALRYEMARELVTGLGDGFGVDLVPAIGTAPTITPIGMAALMPRADQPVTIVKGRNGSIGLRVADTDLLDRKARMKWLKGQHLSNAQGDTATIHEVKLEDLRAALPSTSAWTKADLLVITAQEIDESGETDNAAFRPVMEATLDGVDGACHTLRQLGFATIIITADHGHLYGAPQGDDMLIDAPGGETLDLHRRVWVGRGGAQSPDFLRVPLASLGIAGDFDLAVPWGLGIFRTAGGNRAYMHGGLSLPELIIPVAQVTVTAGGAVDKSEWRWSLEMKRTSITTRIFSVRVIGDSSTLFGTPMPALILELRAGSTLIGRAVDGLPGASFTPTRLADQDRQVSESHMLEVTAESKPDAAITLRLLDAATRRELAQLSLTWGIAL